MFGLSTTDGDFSIVEDAITTQWNSFAPTIAVIAGVLIGVVALTAAAFKWGPAIISKLFGKAKG